MKSMLSVLIVITLVDMANVSFGQGGGGVQWITNLSWDSVKQKATEEKRFIFLDCYTTWCGPCKVMDNNVYGDTLVGKVLNKNFLCIKVQMDKTGKDNDQVKGWYKDAEEIGKQFHVEGYPTYIFLSPQGNVVEKGIGLKRKDEFVSLAESAIKPGKIFEDQYRNYDNAVREYKMGVRDYSKYPLMIKTAFKLRDAKIYNQLIKELSNYVYGLNPKERYTKEMIEAWANFSISRDTRVFSFFYNDGKIIDEVMGEKGYAERVVDKTIHDETVIPFLETQSENSGVSMSGMYLNGPGVKSNLSEADWNKLNQLILLYYDPCYVKRNLLLAKLEWYMRHRNYKAYQKYNLKFWSKYSKYVIKQPSMINDAAFNIFLFSTDKKVIYKYMNWMKKIVLPDCNYVEWIDTYACLLYKLGKKEEAIHWEMKAVLQSLDPKFKKHYNRIVEKMKRDEPVYLEEGAIWEAKK